MGYFEEQRAREEAEREARETSLWAAFTWGVIVVLVLAALVLIAGGGG